MACASTTTGTAAQGLRFLGVVRKKRWGRFGGRGFFSKAPSNQTDSSLLVGSFRFTPGYPPFYGGARRHPAKRRLHRSIEETVPYGPLVGGSGNQQSKKLYHIRATAGADHEAGFGVREKDERVSIL
jgi:hypothetical protein